MPRHSFSVTLMTAITTLMVVAVFAQPGIGKRSDGWGPQSDYARLFDAGTVETISGTVLKVDNFTPRQGMSAGTHLLLKTESGQLAVHLGPVWYLEKQDASIQPNDQIEVTGSRISFENKPAIIASEIKKGDAILVLREESGYPLWSGWRKGWKREHLGRGIQGTGMNRRQDSGQMEKGPMKYDVNTVQTLNGTIMQIMKKDSPMGPWKGIHLMLKNAEQEIEVCLGPEWYIQQQDIELNQQASLEVSGSRITEDGKPVLIAAELTLADKAFVLRDENGFPAWKGWRKSKSLD